jgi:hypothetical protein
MLLRSNLILLSTNEDESFKTLTEVLNEDKKHNYAFYDVHDSITRSDFWSFLEDQLETIKIDDRILFYGKFKNIFWYFYVDSFAYGSSHYEFNTPKIHVFAKIEDKNIARNIIKHI